ncbi:hypothetical protein HMPREF3213_00700 [Heyndrickxia coagulans]|uniref:Uncharacterized protein n=1 Tax=Heyndrickxia coagulans TaxID=1398 RepID=A0A133KZG5_HEYCO|nr:hypothetical protein HMPREF3213_00700 [Heyndrickxia coagulans]
MLQATRKGGMVSPTIVVFVNGAACRYFIFQGLAGHCCKRQVSAIFHVKRSQKQPLFRKQ